MTMDTDRLMERRQARRSALMWKVGAVLAITVLLALVVSGRALDGLATGQGSGVGLFDGEHIARVNVEGIIVEDRWRDELLQDLKDDDKVKGVIVYINSPGGTVVGGENLYLELGALKAEKPVAAVMGSTATSAAYMTAIATDRIFAREGTLTGSIGVLMQTADFTGMMDKLGVKPEVIKSGDFKAQPNPMEPLSDKARAHVQGVVMDMHDLFVTMVANSRTMEKESVLALADGRVFTGRTALKEGLVDAIGGESQAVEWLESEKNVPADLPVVEHEPDYPKPTVAERLLGAFGKALVSERLTLDGLVSVWHPGI